MSVGDLISLVDRLRNGRVLCIGDVMLDRYVYGDVERISPEAPVPVCRVRSEAAMLGGAGNVVRNLAALGTAVDFVSVVGADAAGEDIRRMLGALGSVGIDLIVDSSRPTTIKERFVAGPQQLLRVDRESDVPVETAIADKVLDAARRALRTAKAVVISDYGKGVLADDGLAAAPMWSRRTGESSQKPATWRRATRSRCWRRRGRLFQAAVSAMCWRPAVRTA